MAPEITPAQAAYICKIVHDVLGPEFSFTLIHVHDETGDVGHLGSHHPKEAKAVIDHLAANWSPTELDNFRVDHER